MEQDAVSNGGLLPILVGVFPAVDRLGVSVFRFWLDVETFGLGDFEAVCECL